MKEQCFQWDNNSWTSWTLLKFVREKVWVELKFVLAYEILWIFLFGKEKVILHIVFRFPAGMNMFDSKRRCCQWEYSWGLVSQVELSIVGNNSGPYSERYTMDLREEEQMDGVGPWVTCKTCECLSSHGPKSPPPPPRHTYSLTWPLTPTYCLLEHDRKRIVYRQKSERKRIRRKIEKCGS